MLRIWSQRLIGRGLAGLDPVAVVHSVIFDVSSYIKFVGIREEIKYNVLCGDHGCPSFHLFVSVCL